MEVVLALSAARPFTGDSFVVFFIGEEFLGEKVWRHNFMRRLSPRRWQPTCAFMDAEIFIGDGDLIVSIDEFPFGAVFKGHVRAEQ